MIKKTTCCKPPKEVKQAYFNWRNCLKNNQALRAKLALPKDDEEDLQMCRRYYDKYKVLINPNYASPK